MAKAIALVETRTGCEICEKESRYDVLLTREESRAVVFQPAGICRHLAHAQ